MDVYSWVRACDSGSHIPMNGLFRHASLLARRYTPAIVLPPNQNAPYRGLERLASHLKRAIEVVPSTEDKKGHLWLTLGVDQNGVRTFPLNAIRATILHDVLSAEGHFGEDSKIRYRRGAEFNEVFLCVSETSRKAFITYLIQQELPVQNKTFINYGCFWAFPDHADVPHRSGSLSVHSLFARKNIKLEVELSEMLHTNHTHIGNYGDIPVPEIKSLFRRHHVVHNRNATDLEVMEAYLSHEKFMCLSSAEGFSMPPMEAIGYGIEQIFLSDIPVHREIYGRYGVNFLPLNVPLASADLSQPCQLIRRSEREEIKDRFSVKSVLQPFEAFIKAL